MNKKEVFDILNRLAEGISKTFGNSCETVIHDMKNKKKPIVTIYNGHVTRRKIGDELNLSSLEKEFGDFLINSSTDFVNYKTKTVNGKLIKSSSFHFMGDDYHYAFGINFDYTFFSLAESAIKDLSIVGAELEETMNEAAENRLKNIFEDCVKLIGKPLSMFNKDDRISLVALLQERNAFSFKKSILFVSEKLNISRYTIYNYLKKINHSS